ncbi:MAG TPA: cation:proton antiporter [Candidatus Binatia bacterium]|nr:cation:proton antiporter [Candidatus Binatia bacterium]
MSADPVLFRDLAYVFVAAVLCGSLAWLTRQPLILGYVLGGLIISPLTPGPSVSDIHTFELFAEIGVVLLMFSLGIEFSLKDLMGVKWIAFIGGPIGIVLSIALGLGVGTLLGWSPLQGAVVGMVVSPASTMVLARLLLDRGELHTRHGRIMIGITLVEDLAVVVLIILIPALGALQGERVLAVAKALLTAAAILVPFFYLGARILPQVLARVARTRSDELLLLVALAVGLGAAAVTQAAGLSLALGAFLAGLLINQSDYAHEMLARLLSLRDAFVALFFVTVGVLIDLRVVVDNLALLGVLVGLVVLGQWAIWTLVSLLFRQPLSTALLVGVGLAQIGEFSFILVQVARQAGHVGDDVYSATLAASLVTILINAALVRLVPRWIGPARLDDTSAPMLGLPSAPALDGHVVLCGFGRVGSAIGEALETFGVPYVAIETDPDIVKSLRARNVPAVFGDAGQRVILAAAQVDRAALVILAIPENNRAREAVRRIRAFNPSVQILARVHDLAWRARLMEAGAAEVIQPEQEAASTLIRHALERLSLPRHRVLAYLSRYRTAMESAEAEAEEAGTGLPQLREISLVGGNLVGQSLGEARMRERFGVTVVGVTRATGEAVLDPTAETVLRAGDRLRLFGLPQQIDALVSGSEVLIE